MILGGAEVDSSLRDVHTGLFMLQDYVSSDDCIIALDGLLIVKVNTDNLMRSVKYRLEMLGWTVQERHVSINVGRMKI